VHADLTVSAPPREKKHSKQRQGEDISPVVEGEIGGPKISPREIFFPGIITRCCQTSSKSNSNKFIFFFLLFTF